jgi:phosphodiesterase/alkaline phosphatase D-like protein
MHRSFVLTLLSLSFGLLFSVAALAAHPSLPQMVAAGDVTTDSVVLWARVSSKGPVLFYIVGSGTPPPPVRTVRAVVKDPTIPAKVDIGGLQEGTAYDYYVFAPSGESLHGTFRTPASAGHHGLDFGVSGDWNGNLAPFPSVKNAAASDLDFFVEHGDTIYADFPSPAVPLAQPTTLDEFRAKHAEVYSTIRGLNSLGELRASTAVFAMWDDHEITNDFAGGAPPASDPRFSSYPGAYINETPLFATGLEVFQEYNPVRRETYPDSGDPRTSGKARLYRYRTFGSDAAMFLLDQRSFRDQELVDADPSSPPDILRFLLQSFDLTAAPHRTMLGSAQLADLERDLLDAQARGITWKFVLDPDAIQNFGPLAAADRWEGYARERSALLGFIGANAIDNVVFVTADLHGTVVNNITYQVAPFAPQIPTSSFEIITGAVAVSAPLGPTFVDAAYAAGFITPAQKAGYDALPVVYDSDSIVNDKDDFVKLLANQLIAGLGYDPIGLDGSGLSATLDFGDYIAVHAFGWTQFQIDAQTQRLTVTTWGIPWYTAAQMAADPDGIIGRTPTVISRFHVDPQ